MKERGDVRCSPSTLDDISCRDLAIKQTYLVCANDVVGPAMVLDID